MKHVQIINGHNTGVNGILLDEGSFNCFGRMVSGGLIRANTGHTLVIPFGDYAQVEPPTPRDMSSRWVKLNASTAD